jgi:hypothetical protein
MSTATQGEWRMADGELVIAGVHAAVGAQRPQCTRSVPPQAGDAPASHAPCRLVSDSLHILEQNLLPAAVIEFRGPTVGMTGNSLSGFKGAVIFQKIGDARRSE